jgi:hypothetical protein
VVEGFLLPDTPISLELAVNQVSRCTFDRSHNRDQRVDLVRLLIDERRENQMHMVRHDDGDVKFVLYPMVMTTGRKHKITRYGRQDPSKFGDKRDEMRREVFLEMRQIASIELHAKILACSRWSSCRGSSKMLTGIPTVGMAIGCVGADASSAPLAKRAFGSNVKARTAIRTNSSKALSSPLRAAARNPGRGVRGYTS